MKVIVGSKTVNADTGELFSEGSEVEVEIPDDAQPFNIDYISPFVVVQYVRPGGDRGQVTT